MAVSSHQIKRSTSNLLQKSLSQSAGIGLSSCPSGIPVSPQNKAAAPCLLESQCVPLVLIKITPWWFYGMFCDIKAPYKIELMFPRLVQVHSVVRTVLNLSHAESRWKVHNLFLCTCKKYKPVFMWCARVSGQAVRDWRQLAQWLWRIQALPTSAKSWGNCGLSTALRLLSHWNWEALGTWCSPGLGQCFMKFNVYVSHLDILLKCRFWFSRWATGPEILHF